MKQEELTETAIDYIFENLEWSRLSKWEESFCESVQDQWESETQPERTAERNSRPDLGQATVSKRLSEAQILLGKHLEELGHEDIEFEYQFDPARRWRFDVAVPEEFLACEIEGGIWNHGAHVRGKHFLSDAEKYNSAAMMGWKVVRFTPQQVLTGKAKEWLGGW